MATLPLLLLTLVGTLIVFWFMRKSNYKRLLVLLLVPLVLYLLWLLVMVLGVGPQMRGTS